MRLFPRSDDHGDGLPHWKTASVSNLVQCPRLFHLCEVIIAAVFDRSLKAVYHAEKSIQGRAKCFCVHQSLHRLDCLSASSNKSWQSDCLMLPPRWKALVIGLHYKLFPIFNNGSKKKEKKIFSSFGIQSVKEEKNKLIVIWMRHYVHF